jgi:hypothetical protein
MKEGDPLVALFSFSAWLLLLGGACFGVVPFFSAFRAPDHLLGLACDAEQFGKLRVYLFPFLDQSFHPCDSVVDIHVQFLG